MNSTFPLAVYGLQDAFSGYILYLKLWTSNSDPKLIGRWYMDHLYSTKGNLSCVNNLNTCMHSDCETVKKGSHKHPSWEFIKAFEV